METLTKLNTTKNSILWAILFDVDSSDDQAVKMTFISMA